MAVRLKATRVRRILARKNLSQNSFANHIGTTSGYISQLLNGVRNPSPEMRLKILGALPPHRFDDLFTLGIVRQ
jgi:transcriptional regulator with XRE-family HTH domain